MINWMVQRGLRKQAKRIVDSVAETYAEEKAQHPGSSEHLLYQRILPGGGDPDKLAQLSPSTRHMLDECSQTIEGVCYLVADMSGFTKGWPNFRNLQLTTQIDAALYARGFKRQTKETKERILRALNYVVDNWEEWAGEV